MVLSVVCDRVVRDEVLEAHCPWLDSVRTGNASWSSFEY